jgi:hypothetical protein
MDSMILMTVFGQALTYVVIVGLLLPFVLYVMARWRAQRDPVADTQLGIKVALGYFQVLAFQMLLAGIAVLLYAIIVGGEDSGSFYRTAFGLIVPGALVYSAHLSLLRMTNQDTFPAVRRMLAGYNMLFTGILGMAAIAAAFQALFQHGSSHGFGRAAAAGVLVYGSAWAITGWKFGRMVLGDGPTDQVIPPPSVSAPPTQTGLPPLGPGSFPPIAR